MNIENENELNENEIENEKDDNNNEININKEDEDALIELKNMLDAKEEESKANLDKYMRTLAEYDNYRKRSQKEKSDMYEKGICDTISNFLDIIDNFDRALNGINKEELDDKSKSLYDGIEMIKKQFDKAFSDVGVKQIEALGCEFDPNLHNAVTHVEDESLGENVVAEEFQKGYMYNDRVIRYSMVKVAN